MNIELYLEDQRIDIDKVDFPLNKTFQNLSNPTDIITDYSKTISIPMTKHNNEVLGNAYRLDKLILEGGKNNIGMYLDPTKKIPFKLLYNNELFMSGYAKYNNAIYSVNNKCYNISLFGTIGEIFQKMRDVVVDESKLPAGLGKEYVLDDQLTGNLMTPTLVKDCMRNYIYEPFNQYTTDPDIIGFMPAYRGLYADFKSDKIQINSNTIISLQEYIEAKIRSAYKQRFPHKPGETDADYEVRIDNGIAKLNIGELINDGFKDYQMNEYRINQLKPTINIHTLFGLFKKKIKELTGYDFLIDDIWTAETNPYWTRMCYAFNFLSDSKSNEKKNSTFAKGGTNYYNRIQDKKFICSFTKDLSNLDDTNAIVINPFKLTTFARVASQSTYDNGETTINMINTPRAPEPQATIVTINISYRNKSGLIKSIKYWTSGSQLKNIEPGIEGYNSGNFIDNEIVKSTNNKEGIHKLIVTMPSLNLDDVDINTPLNFEISMFSAGNRVYSQDHCYKYWWWTAGRPSGPQGDRDPVYHEVFIDPILNNDDFTINISDLTTDINWRSHITMNLKSFYRDEKPIFDILLEYTKMFGLIWDVDDVNKKLYLKTRYSYFKDYTIEDWTSKIDKNKDFIIEPVTFNNKYVKFNYDKVKGNNYTDYEDKFGVPYGQKTLKTNYDFNSESKELFKGIKPSCVSNKNFVTLKDVVNWDTGTLLTANADFIVRADCDSEDGKKSIALNNWYFREENETFPGTYGFLTSDTSYQIDHEFCWISPEYMNVLYEDKAVRIDSLPTYTIVTNHGLEYYGCIFNRPNLDYTTDRIISKAGNNYIYDKCWNNYINERYNIQNKKLTCYIDFNPIDWNTFKFNHLVKIDNQLFIVNKIFDYNPNTKGTTKFEFIQVTDINKYIEADYLTNIVADKYKIYFNTPPDMYIHIDIYSATDINWEIIYDNPDGTIEFSDFESFPDGLYSLSLYVGGFTSATMDYTGILRITNDRSTLDIPLIFKW